MAQSEQGGGFARHCTEDAQARRRSGRDRRGSSSAGWSVDLQPINARRTGSSARRSSREAEPKSPHGIASRSAKPLLSNHIQQYVTEVSLAEHNNVVKAFPADRTNQPFGICVLPWGTRRCWSVANAHRSES